MKAPLLLISVWFGLHGNLVLSCDKLPKKPSGEEMIAAVNCLLGEKDREIKSLSSQVNKLLAELSHIKRESAVESDRLTKKVASIEATTQKK